MDLKIKKNIISICGEEFVFYDTVKSVQLPCVFNEIFIGDCYGLKDVSLEENDVVIDIGASVGALSIYLAKKFPKAKILSFEPSEINFNIFLKNIVLNKVENIKAFNLAVYKDSKSKMNITYNESNSGNSGALLNIEGKTYNEAQTISLDDIIKNNNISKVKLLKIDCEGSEYDIIYNSKLFNNKNIEKLAIEIHEIAGKDYKKLLQHILDVFEKENVFYKIISFSENNVKVIDNTANPLPKKILTVEQKKGQNIFHVKRMPFKTRLDRMIGKFGIFLKNKNPRIYYFLKKLKNGIEKNLLLFLI